MTNKEVTFQPGECVIKEKTQCTALYIIKEGQLEAFKTKDGHRVPLGLISSGQYVGETVLLMDTQHTSNVVALTEVKAVMLPRAAIDVQLKQAPHWLVALTRGLVERLRQANEVLRRNDLVDEKMNTAITAIEQKQETNKKVG